MDGPVNHILPREASAGMSPRGIQALIITVVLTSIAAFFVGLRLFTRVGLVKLMGREDWTILLSMVSQAIPRYSERSPLTWFCRRYP